jgi:predicted 2-oxoglutarate/Fe(II)-dependent dioxygenase YbiX
MSELSLDLSATEAAPVRVRECVLARSDCLAVIGTMDRSMTVAGSVLRRSSDMVDPRLRKCSEHVLPAEQSNKVIAAMRAVIGEMPLPLRPLPPTLDGPKFCSYTAGEYFRAHRDRSEDMLDPTVVRMRHLSIVCLLNDADPGGGLPVYDGGALVIHVPRPDGSIAPENIQAPAGSIVTFRADLLHEVRPVRSGVRYSAIAWLYAEDDSKENS